MSYTIRYGEEIKKKEKGSVTVFASVGVIAVFLVCLLACGLAIPEQLKNFREALFPWTQPVVREALEDFRENLNEGVSFREAAEVFCIDLLHETKEK